MAPLTELKKRDKLYSLQVVTKVYQMNRLKLSKNLKKLFEFMKVLWRLATQSNTWF